MARDHIRQQALERIAALSATTTTTSFDRSDLDRLCRACHVVGKRDTQASNGNHHTKQLGRVPMTIREFEVLLALCKAAPSIQTAQSAQRLAYQLVPYMLDAHVQLFVPSPFFRKVEPSPTEALAFHVTGALLSLGTRYSELQETVSDNLASYINACSRAAEGLTSRQPDDPDNANLQDAVRTANIAVSLLGFFDAASAQADFWKAGGRLALIRKIHQLLSEPFLVAVETAFSTLRTVHTSDKQVREWKRCLHHYAAAGRPLGAMLLQRSFMWLMVAATSLMLADAELLRRSHILDVLMSGEGMLRPESSRSADAGYRTAEMYASIPLEMMNYLEASADFVQLGSPFQQKLSFAVKAATLTAYLSCSILNEEAADVDLLMLWLQDCLDDPIQMADKTLGPVVLRSFALTCRISPSLASTVSRLLPRFIVRSAPSEGIVAVASRSLAFVLQMLSQDAVISTLYTLGNVLSPGSGRPLTTNGGSGVLAAAAAEDPSLYPTGRHSTGSAISLQITGEEETAIVYGHVIDAICGIAAACNDEKITALAQSMLLQKIHKVNSNVDVEIITGAAELSLMGGQLEFRSLLKMYSRLASNGVAEGKEFLLGAVMKARSHIAANIHRGSPLYDIFWEHMLDTIISMGDVHQSHHTKESDVQLAAQEIAQLLYPLAVFMSTHDLAAHNTSDEKHSMLRDAWFNIVVHGFATSTGLGRKYINELRVIAVHSPPLVSEQRGEQVESDIELNTVLGRGMSTERENLQKRLLSNLIPAKATEIKTLSYRKVIFLQAAYLVESLRADAGDCTKILSYFLEPSMRRPEVHGTMQGIAAAVLEQYLSKSLGCAEPTFSSQYVAAQLAAVFCACCHRIERVQQAAFVHANNMISWVPSALCHRSSLFALLELLSLMWSSCLEAETDLYAPRSIFTSKLGNVTVELSDDYRIRRDTLDLLYRKAKHWVSEVINLAPHDIKGHLQTYLSEFDDEGAYGHISLGRSFAIELGSMIPASDQRLQSLDRVGSANINTGSDLIAQYTTRQEYRYGESLPSRGLELMSFMHHGRSLSFAPSADSANAATALAHVEARILAKKSTQLDEVRDILRRAAALLCRSRGDEAAVTHHLVSIPFALFTKQSIKLGTSLWLGVMNENPRLEPRLLNEIAQQWEFTIQKRIGLFGLSLSHMDPFLQKAEFAPSDLEALSKHKAVVHNLLAPHQRLIQFFGCHFNATRLACQNIHKVFLRLLNTTLDAVNTYSTHPMARELRLDIVLFGLRALRHSTTIGDVAQYRFKEKLLSAALNWFKHAPKWSFGSNMLQLKTEIKLIADVTREIQHISFADGVSIGNVSALQAKEQLLQLLLENEKTRLAVWVHPLGEQRVAAAAHYNPKAMVQAVLPLVRVAWAEDPALALDLAVRFPSPLIHKEVRTLLRSCPERAVDDPEALSLLLGGLLPEDIGFPVLKYLLCWAPVAPITAITLFLPAYRNHPFLIQYAMRALESHSIDITFFYVPQIVQTLRYDALGYVERYILEAAQVSQLFAHQIIWNMKANSYKDDDSQMPDEIKPTLDHVTDKMITGFSETDRAFFEKEFAFFDEVTGISGKLKPFIQRSKPEKKQKIEEELRKIRVEVGVYLPSNPDGIVIGIDRKSGKPLQSHAKAPYMATFRIKKKQVAVEDAETPTLEDAGAAAAAAVQPQQQHQQQYQHQQQQHDHVKHQDGSVEVWQSAIFKVGDDCRQDVLALQMIAAFRNIFHGVGLDVYVFPYRVTATAPGCGVIDVLPNSISRDMLGREAVNGLYDYFISKYGNEDSLRFQRARSNFVKSMAAYSVISFLLQFKDRHNGNIMFDDMGHILHIDFGFCFDIAPGGIKFERAPFKLTTEMVAVMGGSMDHQAFKWFEELTVKAFLASRQHAERLAQIVLLMMDSGLPCFRPESVKHFLDRFVMDKSEREAADFMKDLIRKSYSSYSTGIYDQFQLLTNGIPF